MTPQLEDLYQIQQDAGGAPLGLQKRHDRLRAMSAEVDAASLLKALNEEMTTVLGALYLIPTATLEAGATRQALIDALIQMLPDTRVHVWNWGTRAHQHRTFEVSTLAAEALIALLEVDLRRWQSQRHRKRWSTTDEVTPPEAQEPDEAVRLARALCVYLEGALQNMAGPGAVRAIMRGLRNIWWRLGERTSLCTALAACFERIAADPTQVAHLRCQAARELHRIANARVSVTDAAFEQAQRRVLDALIATLTAPDSDFRLRRALPALLMDISPESISPLQAQGLLNSAPIPSLDELISPWGRPQEERLKTFAHMVNADEFWANFAGHHLEGRLAAAALSPPMSRRLGWRAVAEALLDLLASTDWYTLDAPHRKPRRGVALGEFASERLLKTIAPMLRQGDPDAADLAQRALAVMLNRRTLPRRGAADPLKRYTDMVRWLPESAQQKLRELMLPRLMEPEGAVLMRAAACLLISPRDAWEPALKLLMNGREAPALRAWFGAWLHRWQPERLEDLVDTEEEHWRLLADTCAELPISEPGIKVPMSWLLASLNGAQHPLLSFTIARQVGARLGLAHKEAPDETMHLQDRLHDNARETLRLVLDAPPQAESPRWYAAITLALQGCPTDEARLVNFMVHHGPWTRLDPSQDDFDDHRPLDHLVLRPLGHSQVHHMLEPYLRTGYGPQHAARLMARTFARLGGHALGHGHINNATLAIRRALEFDKLNLNAQRAARSLNL